MLKLTNQMSQHTSHPQQRTKPSQQIQPQEKCNPQTKYPLKPLPRSSVVSSQMLSNPIQLHRKYQTDHNSVYEGSKSKGR